MDLGNGGPQSAEAGTMDPILQTAANTPSGGDDRNVFDNSLMWKDIANEEDPSYDTLDYGHYQDIISSKDTLPPPLPDQTKALFLVLYIVIMIVSLFGNVVVVIVVGRSAKLRTVTNAFLVSLAISDLLIVTVNMPLQLAFILQNEWKLGWLACKLTNYLQGVTIVVSILTLTGIAVDRYYAICHPFKARHVHTLTRAVVILALFWFVSMVMLIPQLFIQRLEPLLSFHSLATPSIRIAYVCVEYFSHHYLNILYTLTFYILLFLLPVVIMLVTYGRIAHTLWFRRQIGETPSSGHDLERHLSEKRRIVRMLVVIVMMFAISWLPFFTCQVYLLFFRQGSPHRLVVAILQLFGYSNSCINPIIYCFLNESFKKKFLKVICHHLAHINLLQSSLDTERATPTPTTINNTTF